MRKKFSEKYGFNNIRDSLQIKSMDEALKNRLWNAIQTSFIDTLNNNYGTITGDSSVFIKRLYDEYFKLHEDPDSNMYRFKQGLKKRYFALHWYEVYDLVEFIPEIYYYEPVNTKFRKIINTLLEAEMSGYRFVDNYIAPIVDDIEIKEIENAMDCGLSGAKQHISNAIELFSDRESPDYVNSIKESISAVESICKNFLGKNTALGSCLNQLTFDFSPTFKAGITKMYNWTSQDGGIRHGQNDEEIVISFEDAKYMLVICSAFVNYLVAKKAKS